MRLAEDNLRVITIRKTDREIKQFIRDMLLTPVTLFVVFFTGIYVVFIGTSIYANFGFFEQITINLSWALFYYLYLFIFAPQATIWMIDHRVPFFMGTWCVLFVPCLFENIVGSLYFGLDDSPTVILANTLKNIAFMAPGLAILLALFRKKFEAGIFIVPPVEFIWFRWQDRRTIGTYNSAKEPIRIEAQNQYCTIYRNNELPELERISMSDAIEKYCFKAEGMRVHRSHWIAFKEVKDVKYINGNPKIDLESGDRIPASRNAYQHLKYYCAARKINGAILSNEKTENHSNIKIS